MRLIDADALEEHKFLSPDHPNATRVYDETTKAYQRGWNDAIDAIIDNAPTVPLPDFKEGYKQAIIDGKTNFSRPQGEWGKWVISEIRCPNCLEYFQTDCYSTEELKKCPNCGTKMNKKEETNNEEDKS